MEMKFNNQVFKCYITVASVDLDVNTEEDSIENEFEKKFLRDFAENTEKDYSFYSKLKNIDMTEGIEDVSTIKKGTSFMAVYDDENNFIGKIHLSRKDYDFRLNIMYIYACNSRRIKMEEKKIKNYTKSSIIIWSFAALYAKILYGKFARILIPLPRHVVIEKLLAIGCLPVLIDMSEDLLDSSISKNQPAKTDKIVDLSEKYENHGMIFVPSDLI